jgi:hypothetical protein
MIIRDRIKELKRVRASELLPNPKNWRTHPTAQRSALEGMLTEVGYADALIARETDEGLMLIDGHLRAETTPDAEVPVLILDVNEKEAEKILATLDPLAAMARPDNDILMPLLEGLNVQDGHVNAMLEALANGESEILKELELISPEAFPVFDEDIETAFKCPSCKYEWSGAPK